MCPYSHSVTLLTGFITLFVNKSAVFGLAVFLRYICKNGNTPLEQCADYSIAQVTAVMTHECHSFQIYGTLYNRKKSLKVRVFSLLAS